MESTKREELPPHTISEDGQVYLEAMTERQRELHEMAVKMLGSSYFVERTHGFRKWKAKMAESGGK
jgi:hypothetical protein